LLGGMKPQTHTKPKVTRDGRHYSPSVVVTGASEGRTRWIRACDRKQSNGRN
jgi:hypothetical protein